MDQAQSLHLEHKTKVGLKPIQPFNFTATFYKPGHFPSQDTYWNHKNEVRWQTMVWQGKRLGLKFWQGKDEVVVEVHSTKKLDQAYLKSLKGGYRAKSIKRISRDFMEDKVDEFALRKVDIETQREKLLELYGIGPATVGYVLFEVFHRLNLLDDISLWEQKIYSKLIFDTPVEEPKSVGELLEFFSRYEPYKMLAVHYLWEDLWWKRENKNIPWLEGLIRL